MSFFLNHYVFHVGHTGCKILFCKQIILLHWLFFLHVSPYSSLPFFLKAIIMGFEEDKLVTNVF